MAGPGSGVACARDPWWCACGWPTAIDPCRGAGADTEAVAHRTAQAARAAGAATRAIAATSAPNRVCQSLTIRVYRRAGPPCLYCV